MIKVLDLQSWMVTYILDKISMNVGRLVTSDVKFFKNHSGKHFLFPYLITELSKRVGFMEYVKDTWVHPNTPVYPFKI